jgi:hypothetical protein
MDTIVQFVTGNWEVLSGSVGTVAVLVGGSPISVIFKSRPKTYELFHSLAHLIMIFTPERKTGSDKAHHNTITDASKGIYDASMGKFNSNYPETDDEVQV